jgi:uroporphyrin-III C-methyltransferase
MASDTKAALIQSAATPEQRMIETTLARLVEDAKKHGIGSPAILVVGSIVGLRQDLSGMVRP